MKLTCKLTLLGRNFKVELLMKVKYHKENQTKNVLKTMLLSKRSNNLKKYGTTKLNHHHLTLQTQHLLLLLLKLDYSKLTLKLLLLTQMMLVLQILLMLVLMEMKLLIQKYNSMKPSKLILMMPQLLPLSQLKLLILLTIQLPHPLLQLCGFGLPSLLQEFY